MSNITTSSSSPNILNFNLPLESLSIKNKSLICVGGRKVISHNNDTKEFYEKINLRAKIKDRNFIVNQIDWNKKKEQYILTSPSNGNVILWNLKNKMTNKIESIYEDHREIVNSICWYHGKPDCFLSGSRDQTVKFWDIRTKNQKKSEMTINCKNVVCDIDVNKMQNNLILIGLNNGYIQIYDINNISKPLHNFREVKMINTNPVTSVKWHPRKSKVFCTGGRSKMLTIWNFKNVKEQPLPIFSIPTHYHISNCRWREKYGLKGRDDYQIGTTPQAINRKFHIWDSDCVYIPKYEFYTHSDIVTDFCWLDRDDILSVSKDGTLRLTNISSAKSVRKDIQFRRSALSWNVHNEVACYSTYYPSSRLEKFDLFGSVQQFLSKKLKSYKKLDRIFISNFEMIHGSNYVSYFAENYKCFDENLTVTQKCFHNSLVAKKIGRHDLSKFWDIIEKVYTSKKKIDSILREKEDEKARNEKNLLNEKEKSNILNSSTIKINEKKEGKGEEESEEGESDSDEYGDTLFSQDVPTFLPSHRSSENVKKLFLDVEEDGIESGDEHPPYDAYDEKLFPQLIFLDSKDESSLSLQLKLFKDVIKETLTQYSDEGDVQTCVSVCNVLGNSFLGFDENTVIEWTYGYFQILRRLKLFTSASEIIKYSSLARVKRLQKKTKVKLSCGNCGREIKKGEVICKGSKNKPCDKRTSKCIMCDLSVKGTFVACKCGYGGHFACLIKFHNKYQKCPKCGKKQ